MAKIINIVDKSGNAKMQSPESCLRDCLDNDIGKQRVFKSAKKLVIIALDDTSGGYDTSWNQAGMSIAEMVLLLEMVKLDLHAYLREV